MDRIKFKVNGEQHSVGCEVASSMTLVDYLRDHQEQRGTKYMCREGGCGACVVAAVKVPGGPTLSVNSCMISITSCQDWEITTIEELGNRQKGYHILQKTLADQNGTQCGYCSPAWVMNMYSLLKNGDKPTMLEIEQAFGSNVCRCTGYRPILDAFKKFGSDAPKTDEILDIEDLHICKKTGEFCKKTKCDNEDDDWCILENNEKVINVKLKDNKWWFKVYDIRSIFQILDRTGYDSYMLVLGNTAKGVYPIVEYPNLLIDISSVQELKVIELDRNLVIGAGVTLTELAATLKNLAKHEYFGYLQRMYEHIQVVAHIPVRNLGSVGGNLMIKYEHNFFPSDIYLLFETVGAYLTIVDLRGITKTVTMQQFLAKDMKGKVILNALLPPLTNEYKFYSHKVMPRSQNAHAIVNAGFLFKLSPRNEVLEARMVFGGLSPCFTRAHATERYLIGKLLFSNETLQSALSVLEKEMVVIDSPPEPSVEYRKHLVLALFYKCLINICPKSILNQRYHSESTKIHETRSVSQGTQLFDTDKSLWPLNEPIPKVEALIQCAGETMYSDDIPIQPHEVYAAFVLTTVALGDIVNIDASRALKQAGVLGFYSAKDIPGTNSFIPQIIFLFTADEEILCSGKVQYYNQPYGIIVAETQNIAEAAAKMVTATYENTKAPVVDIKNAKNDEKRLTATVTIPATDTGVDVKNVIKGENTIYGQYHFTMENIGCVTIPTEEGIEVYATSQWTNGVQVVISRALKIDENRIDVHVRRLGGAFGIKISRPNQVAAACSLVTQKMNRPCRFVLPLTTTTRTIGKRLPCHTEYECQVNSEGVIQSINYTLYEDGGYILSENLSFFGLSTYSNCYNSDRWYFKGFDVITDNAKNTWCRSPGSLESISMAETVLERISYELNLDPFDVRIANLDAKHNDLKQMAENLKTSASYAERNKAKMEFNKNNRWRKRGLRCSFARWHCVAYLVLDVNLSVFHSDGTVIITHGGIEMGQGINTKAVQIAAYYLKIPVTKIQIKANNTNIAPNTYVTGASIGSQCVGIGVRRCCETLLERLMPIRVQMVNPEWTDLINQAYASNVDLQVHNYVGAQDNTEYDIYGVAMAEVEVDILTGESEILRVDILQDVGQSVSPEIDVGQVEGAFVMGLGYWTSENLVYDQKTGELLTDRTWNYYVPQARDIPQDFRISFRKNSYGFPNLLGAKATGEPPICLSIVVAFALREAIAEARFDMGIPKTKWFEIEGSFTVERVAMATETKKTDYKLT